MFLRHSLQNDFEPTPRFYDTHGRQNVITDARTGSVTNYFNNADQVSGMRLPSADGIQSPQITSNLFDNMGRIVTNILADSTTVTSEYYLTGQPKRTYGSRTYPVGYGYDAQGRMTKMTNWSNFATTNGARVTTWTNNQYRGWLDSKHYDGTNAGPVYSYTAAGRLQNRLWARGTNTTYSYNDAGDLATVTYDDGLTLGITNGYDRRGRLISIINGPSTCSLAYDDAGNLMNESYSGGVLDLVSIQNIYDEFLRRKTNVTKYNGTPLTIVTNNYDLGGRYATFGDGTNSATYSYLANSPLVSQILSQQNGSNRMTMKQGFDNLNRLTGITNANPSSVTLDKHTYVYNAANQRTAVTQADNSVWSFGYDSLGQVTSGRKFWGDSTPVAGQQFGYSFDDIGNRTQAQAGGSEIGVGLRSANYSANAVNQYTSRTVPGTIDIIGSATNSSIVTVNETPTTRHGDYFRAEVGVDNGTGAAFQSVTAKAVVGGATNLLSTVTGNTFLPQNPESFSYDADGNLTQDGRWQYKWDAENRLIAMTNNSNVPNGAKMTLNFGYDYQGRRISKLVSNYVSGSYQVTTKLGFVYDGWNLQVELNGTNNSFIRSYIWGSDLSGRMRGAGGVGGLLAVSKPDSSEFTCFDGNGNIIAFVDAGSSAMTEQLEYGPFGELLRISGSAPDSTPFGYSTKYTDGESGLVYYGNRIYSPKIGSWSSRDPMGDLVCHNLYQFVFGDPISFVDVLGFDGQRFGGPRIRPPAYQGGARGAGPAPRSPMVLEPLIPYPDGTQPAVMQVVGASISGFSQLCKSEGHCPCPNWGNIWIIMTLGQTSYKGCVGQTKDAAAALQKLAATGFGGEYSLIWMYRWQPLPHNWLVLAPVPGSDVPRIVVDYWKGIIEVEYPRRTMFVSLSCNPFQYQVGFRPTQ